MTEMIEPIRYPGETFSDERGWLRKLEPVSKSLAFTIPKNFNDFYVSKSRKHVFRGLHVQRHPHLQWKFIRVISGAITSYMINLDSQSKCFNQVYCFQLEAEDGSALLWPPLHANSFLSLSNDTTIAVPTSGEYKPSCELVISPTTVSEINLPEDCIISSKDKAGLDFRMFNGIS